MPEPLLEIRGLRISGWTPTGRGDIVQGVDFLLRKGEVLGLIGESGSGKSTLGLAALGYTRHGCSHVGGTVTFKGVDLFAAPAKVRRLFRGLHISYVAQSAAASFNPAYRLLAQLVEVPVQHSVSTTSEAKRRGEELCGQLGLSSSLIGTRFPHQMSGGQLQRAMIAMAMMCRPDLIVFDEPTTALDVSTQIEVLMAIRNVVRDIGTAAIYISHDLAVVAQMADRIVVLREGMKVEEGETRRLLTKPQAPYTESLIAARSLTKVTRWGVNAGEVLLNVRNLSVRFGELSVVKDVNFEIRRGRTLALIGESGSGKTTTARAIVGLQKFHGDIVFEDRCIPPLAQRDKSLLRRIQLIHQTPDTALNPRQTVRQIVSRPLVFYFGLRGVELERRVQALLHMVELDPSAHGSRTPAQLSGGQKQRLCIARALAAEPELLVCDEVTSAVDQVIAESLLKTLTGLRDALKLTCLFITHDLGIARAIAEDVVVMQNGMLVESGRTEQVLASPKTDYCRNLCASVPQLDTDWLTNRIERARTSVDCDQVR